MARVEVITGPERRRRWSAEQKRAIVAESLASGAVVTEIARRAEIGPGQIYRWRRELGVGNGFAQVLMAPAGDDAGCPAAPAIEIEFAAKARMRIPASIPAGLALACRSTPSGWSVAGSCGRRRSTASSRSVRRNWPTCSTGSIGGTQCAPGTRRRPGEAATD